jgi:hypothetical protein
MSDIFSLILILQDREERNNNSNNRIMHAVIISADVCEYETGGSTHKAPFPDEIVTF